MKVLKFGGSSLGTPEIIKEVKDIVEGQQQGTIVVVSAFKGVTDQLLQTAEQARSRDKDYIKQIDNIRVRHEQAVKQLIPAKIQQDSVIRKVNDICNELSEICNGIFYLKDITPKVLDMVVSFGERLSAYIVSEIINDAFYSDARKFIKTDSCFGNAKVDFEKTNKLVNIHFVEREHYMIVPGFIASNDEGETTTLGRGGSDYTAAIIAAAMEGVAALEIWTDVDGFMTADPRVVDRAYPVKTLTYAEAMELSHFGAKVIYTPTIKPVYQRNIPVVVKNTFNPGAVGTVISKTRKVEDGKVIKGISSINDISLMTLQGPGMVGVKGTSMRLFGAIAKANVNIILITQASSEYSISFAITPADKDNAVQAIEEEFHREIILNEDIRLNVEDDLSIIAIVGEEMRNTPGISGTLFQSLGQNGVNVRAIAQGSSELNISVVVSKKSLQKAMNVIHEGFFLSFYKVLHLYLVGIGNVGSRLLNQIANQQKKLLDDHHLIINLVGIANSKKMLLQDEGIKINDYAKQLDKKGESIDLKKMAEKIGEMNLRNSVFIDCTASSEVANVYKDVMNSFASIVTANKIACSSEYSSYYELLALAKKKNVWFYYETNVGAGLPVIKTIDEMINSGDKILKIEAVLSGTLNYIFNQIGADIPFSRAVEMAMEKGYAEPDPRIDLSGVDVARKILILSRRAGYKIEPEEIENKSFLPKKCFEGSIDDFWKEIKKIDLSFEEQRKEIEKGNKKWRFVATMENGKASVELVTIDNTHPAFFLEGSNNIIMIKTERYKDDPMVIKGYGAGAEVTAAGLFADIIRITNI